MQAKSFAILEKRRYAASIAVVSIDDFSLEENGETAVSITKSQPTTPTQIQDYRNG